MRMPSLLTVVLVTLWLAGSLVCPSVICAEEPSPPKLLNMDIKGGDIGEALDMLGRTQGIDIIVRPGVQGTLPSMRIRDRTAEQALWLIGNTLGFQVFKKNPTTYVVAPPGTEPQLLLVEPWGKPEDQPPSLRADVASEPAAPLRVKVAVLGQAIDKLELSADQIRADPPTDMYTLTAPSAESIRQILAAAEGIGIQPKEGILQAGEEQSFEFIWPKDRPQYYLEEVEPDLYRRVELVDKEGYLVRVRRSEGKAEITVELEIARRTLSGGRYDEAIRAFVGRPTLTKTVVTRTVPLTNGESTLVFWQAPSHATAPVESTATPLTTTVRAPSWAVGWWELSSPKHGNVLGILNVLADGSVTMEGKRATATATGSIEPSGQLYYRCTDAGDVSTISGKLYPNGSGAGTLRQEFGDRTDTQAWTATKGGGLEGSPEPFAPGLLESIRTPEAAPGPAGVAVLLEIGPAAEAPEIPEPIRALIEKPGPAIQIEYKFVEIQKDPDKPLARDWEDNPEQWLREQLQAGKAQLINAPSIATRNGVPAEVEFITEIPYFYATISYNEFGQRTVDFETDTVSVGQSISVTPTLQAEGQILMDIDFRVDRQVGTVVGPEGQGLPIVTTQSGSLESRVADGETLVIGSLTGSNQTFKLKTPGAEVTPMMGELSRQRMAASGDTELLIFVTPKAIGSAPALSLPFAGVITGEIRDGERWVWDQIALRYAEATEIARTFGGMVFRDGEVSSPPPARQHPYPPGVERPAPSAAGGVTLPIGMDPPVAIVEHNALLVHGTQEAIDTFREILAFFDKPTKQIEIEARFVEVAREEGKAFGIDWFVANGSAEFFKLGFRPGTGINVARFRKGRFGSELKALLDEGRAEIVSAPRVTAQNNMTAQVDFCREIPYTYATISYDEHGKRQVEYETETVSVMQSLTVTPRILADNSIVLYLEPKIQNQVGTLIGPQGEVLPIVSTQAFYTQVRVADGDTIVIGGLTRTTEVLDPKQVLPPEETAETEASAETKRVEKELLIFVTPRILREIPRQ